MSKDDVVLYSKASPKDASAIVECLEKDKVSKKLVKAKLSLGLGLRVPKRLLIKNVKRLKHVVKKGRVKHLAFLKKRSALLFSVEKRYLLADEGVTYQVANICLYVDLLRDSPCTTPIQHIDDFIALEIIHAVRPFTEAMHILFNSDALLTLIKKRASGIVLPFTTDSKHGGRN
nr:hypothetical protein CFP56_49854 [Quercus suber]